MVARVWAGFICESESILVAHRLVEGRGLRLGALKPCPNPIHCEGVTSVTRTLLQPPSENTRCLLEILKKTAFSSGEQSCSLDEDEMGFYSVSPWLSI